MSKRSADALAAAADEVVEEELAATKPPASADQHHSPQAPSPRTESARPIRTTIDLSPLDHRKLTRALHSAREELGAPASSRR
uniref:hypothetical protein n=1 Tax=Amycolatopsis sp. CA-290885 TaxID=3239925 RepID=UPI003F497FAD